MSEFTEIAKNAVLCGLEGCFKLTGAFLANPITKFIGTEMFTLATSKKFDFQTLVKETNNAVKIFRMFEKTIDKLDRMQNEHKLQICSVENSKVFLKEYRELLEMYDAKQMVKQLQERYWPDWYRENLHKHLSFVNVYMNQLQYDIMNLVIEVKKIEKLPSREERNKAWNSLRNELKC